MISNSIHSNDKLFFVYTIKEEKAAICLQKHIRRFLYGPHLQDHLYPHYKKLCEGIENKTITNMPRATAGNTPVYFPHEMPQVILKHCGKGRTRFDQMQLVRAITKSHKSFHLTIPKANRCGRFLVEERLPISSGTLDNVGIYCSQPQMFDNAVREMTRLFSKMALSDLFCWSKHPLQNIKGVDQAVRYDNLPLYIEKNRGKIGLIDLERSNFYNQGSLEDLARIFPLHLEIIIDEARKLDMKFEEKALSESADQGKKYLKAVFSDHAEWLSKKNITNRSIEISSEFREEIVRAIEKNLLMLNRGESPKSNISFWIDRTEFINGNPEETVKELAPSLFHEVIKNFQSPNEDEENFSISELVKFRTKEIDKKYLFSVVENCLKDSEKFNFTNEDSIARESIGEVLADSILIEIFSRVKPFQFTNHDDFWWIRF